MNFLRRSGLLRLLVFTLICCFSVAFAVRRWGSQEWPVLYTASLTDVHPDGVPAGTRTLRLTGTSLYRVNRVYIDGKRVALRHYVAVSYSEGLASLDEGSLAEEAGHLIEVGKGYFGNLVEFYRSNAVAIGASP